MNTVFILLFLAMIWLPIIQSFTNFVQLKSINKHINEKRKLAPFPEKIDYKTFPNDFESYSKDQFGFRIPLILLNNQIKYSLFNLSATDRVIVGKDGWLFKNLTRKHSGNANLAPFKGSEIELITENLNAIKKHLQDSDIEFYLCIIPNKSSVYSTNLPDEYFNDSQQLRQVVKICNEIDLPLINLMKPLEKQCLMEEVYQKEDSHWNRNGGFIGANVILNFIDSLSPWELFNRTKDNYEIKLKEHQAGDLIKQLGLLKPLNNRRYEYQIKHLDYQRITPCFDLEYDFDYKKTFAYRGLQKNSPGILVFNDSFVSYIKTFLAPSFSQSHFYWTLQIDKGIIEKVNPDIVLLMLVESNLPKLKLRLK